MQDLIIKLRYIIILENEYIINQSRSYKSMVDFCNISMYNEDNNYKVTFNGGFNEQRD